LRTLTRQLSLGVNAVLIFALIVGPMTALLIWVIVCELRGVPAFADAPPPQPGELDSMGRWILGGVCLVLAATSYAYGGVVAMLGVASIVAAVATFIASAWTLGQSAKHWALRKRAIRRGAEIPHSLRPIHQRFALNFRRTIIQLPIYFVAHG
jgi:hypothetical protein